MNENEHQTDTNIFTATRILIILASFLTCIATYVRRNDVYWLASFVDPYSVMVKDADKKIHNIKFTKDNFVIVFKFNKSVMPDEVVNFIYFCTFLQKFLGSIEYKDKFSCVISIDRGIADSKDIFRYSNMIKDLGERVPVKMYIDTSGSFINHYSLNNYGGAKIFILTRDDFGNINISREENFGKMLVSSAIMADSKSGILLKFLEDAPKQ